MIAVALGTLVLGEPFHARMLVAAAIIVTGILIVGPASSAKGVEAESVS
jgi:drug/metabolite transporter (DMT)-like permease